MMPPLLIVGPTSSGKTSLSFFLAKHFKDVDILVVDSKQVYRDQDIVTGKDLTEETNARIFGVDIRNPDQNWSISQFIAYARNVIADAQKENRLLIIVGGTPQYVLSLFSQPESIHTPVNPTLRQYLENLSVEQLQKEVSADRLARMNASDRQNPRRLVRAIEIEASPVPSTLEESVLEKSDCVWVGLQIEKEILAKRITGRVSERVENGAVKEYENIQKKYRRWELEAKAAIGYKEIEQHVRGELSGDELIDLWTTHEIQYAKRQMQWWKREPQIQWFDATSASLQIDVLGFVKNCYNK
ncbi:MAG: tRNA (adenosine(37)-N6)-dimethylallyltransferase MiaA [Candidatus Woesebacteria bacterium]